MRIILRKATTFLRTNWQQKAWFIPLYLLSGLARLAILLAPFRHLAPLLGSHHQNAELSVLITEQQEQHAQELKTVIRMATKYTPWESKCLVQALLAKVVLSFHGIPHVSYLGVTNSRKEAHKLEAHAWVSAGRIFVTGGNGHRTFTVVSSFISDTSISQPVLST